MTEQEITEGNKLIAEFMGGPENPLRRFYDTDWNCIMKVLKRVEDITIPVGWVSEPWPTRVYWGIGSIGGLSFNIGDNSLFITSQGIGNAPQVNKLGFGEGTIIELSFKALVNFIKWYNQNKTT